MIGAIFKKELKDTLRDRRTLIMMLVIPILIFPIIMNIFASVSRSFAEEAANKKVQIGLISAKGDEIVSHLKKLPASLGKKEIIPFTDSLKIKKAIKEGEIDFGFFVPTNDNKAGEIVNTEISVFYDGTDLGSLDRAKGYLTAIDEILKQKRYQKLNINENAITPLTFNYSNVASDTEMVGKLAGGVLPYIFIVFGFIGCMYPAIDLFTGEKERGTIETLLTTPVPRWKILFGKMGVVVLSGLLASTFSLIGLYLSIEVFQLVEDQTILDIMHSILSLKFVLILFSLLIPMTIFFAGIMIPIAIYAKTFKEAQSIITPLNIVMVLPAMIGFFPGIELNAITASIPVVNVVLATKELIAGTLSIGYLALSFIVMTALAVFAVFISYRRFDKETNVVLS